MRSSSSLRCGVWLCLALCVALRMWQPAAAQDSRGAPREAQVTIDDGQDRQGADRGTIPTTNLMKVFRDGGVVMYVILCCSVVSLVFVFERTISLRRGRVIPRPFVKRFRHQMREGKLTREQALQLCEENKSHVAFVFAAALRKWGKPAVEVEQAVIDAGERVTNDLRKYLRVFNVVSTVSPLLGLLGTVFGMISAFNAVATSNAMGRPELLAGGIAEAMLTTAFGLTVAIPALVCYWFFVSIVDRRIIEIDALGQDLVNLICGDASVDPVPKPARTRRREAGVEVGQAGQAGRA